MTTLHDFGWWTDHTGRRRLLTWWASGAVTLDGPGGVECLGYIETEQEACDTFAGWEHHTTDPDGADWIRARVAAYRIAHACFVCNETGRIRVPDPLHKGAQLSVACPACAIPAVR